MSDHTHIHHNTTRHNLRHLYTIKRSFVFFDEWMFYIALLVMYHTNVHPLVLALVIAYGALAVSTGYKNLDIIEKELHGGRTIPMWFVWPIWS